ncbi:MAG: formylglycine-generating enzyme family protein [Candidatus Cloacimonetes bacterium]|nr:formylglycine-generating enzyme family protein [Candidatus Cloacimonadota bacterium]
MRFFKLPICFLLSLSLCVAETTKASLMDEAARALKAQDFSEASAIYQKLYELDYEKTPDFMAEYGLILWKANQPVRAREMLLHYVGTAGVDGRFYVPAIQALSQIAIAERKPASQPEPEIQVKPKDPSNRENLARNLFIQSMSALRTMPTTLDAVEHAPAWLVESQTIFAKNSFFRWNALYLTVLVWKEIQSNFSDTAMAQYLKGPKNPLKLQDLESELYRLDERFHAGMRYRDAALDSEFILLPPGIMKRQGHSEQRVLFSDAIFMGKSEVTQGQWLKVMGSNPAYFTSCGLSCPVENVSWDDIQEFLARVNQNSSDLYRLPTELEWEYAANHFPASPQSSPLEFAWFDANSLSVVHASGLKDITGLGFSDLFGNVWEWISDSFTEDSSLNDSQSSLILPEPNNNQNLAVKTVRGGAYDSSIHQLSPFFRQGINRTTRQKNLGFRLVLQLK